MTSLLERRVQDLLDPACKSMICDINRGLEKESLRITTDGRLAQTTHPEALGSALTHSSITTDYSEALMEFITPPKNNIEDSLAMLEDVHSFVYQNLDEELLWATSMPCVIGSDASIPVARYGDSNVAQMKTIYRYGLGHRYGRKMQAIAGIHYNFSMPLNYWQHAWESEGQPGELECYITARYLGLIRNFRRFSWLLVYLYGASPAVCASFLKGVNEHGLQPFDDDAKSLYLPYATALRMGDLGYSSDAQEGLNVCYNSLDKYIETLRQAIQQSHPAYGIFSSGENGEYEQLSDGLLQIENEFYSPIRPKRVAYSGETPLSALRRGGIEYIEVRCIDVSPFAPAGLDEDQIRFMDIFLLYCLLSESPPCDDEDQKAQDHNLEAVVNRGRQPGLKLHAASGEIELTEWAHSLLAEMSSVASMLRDTCDCSGYEKTLQIQRDKVSDPDKTPSARVLREMSERDLPFFRLGLDYSQRWAKHFRERQLDPAVEARFREESTSSIAAQGVIEADDDVDFAQYLQNFYAQYDKLAP